MCSDDLSSDFYHVEEHLVHLVNVYYVVGIHLHHALQEKYFDSQCPIVVVIV